MNSEDKKLLLDLADAEKKYKICKDRLDRAEKLRDAYRLILQSKGIDVNNPPNVLELPKEETPWPQLKDAMIKVLSENPSGLPIRKVYDLAILAGVNPGPEPVFRNKVYRLKPDVIFPKRGVVKWKPKHYIPTVEEEDRLEGLIAAREDEEAAQQALVDAHLDAQRSENERIEALEALVDDPDDIEFDIPDDPEIIEFDPRGEVPF